MNFHETEEAIKRGAIRQFKLVGSGWFDANLSPDNPNLRVEVMEVSGASVKGDSHLQLEFRSLDGFSGLIRTFAHPTDVVELYQRAGISGPQGLVGRVMDIYFLGLTTSIGLDFPQIGTEDN
ncbi:hypothetical protein HYS91_00940 [Candidatus Daviesbacteria bacterium]|nr:hypothetical protein [Candidatus Daviesbacteria bacterium]